MGLEAYLNDIMEEECLNVCNTLQGLAVVLSSESYCFQYQTRLAVVLSSESYRLEYTRKLGRCHSCSIGLFATRTLHALN